MKSMNMIDWVTLDTQVVSPVSKKWSIKKVSFFKYTTIPGTPDGGPEFPRTPERIEKEHYFDQLVFIEEGHEASNVQSVIDFIKMSNTEPHCIVVEKLKNFSVVEERSDSLVMIQNEIKDYVQSGCIAIGPKPVEIIVELRKNKAGQIIARHSKKNNTAYMYMW